MSESSEVEGRGIAVAAARSTNALAELSPIKEGGGGATIEDSTLGCLELALI